MNITFRQVDAFRTVISTGTVTEAAQMLGISQPAVSRLISDFETEVGFTLFQRVGRVLVATDEARLLVGEVRQAVSGMEHIKDAAKAIGHFGHARISIVTAPGFSADLTPDLVAGFSEKMPNSSVRMEIEANDDTIEWMVSQNFDFGITTSEPSNPSFDHIVIQDEDVFGVLPSSHKLAQMPKLTPKDFISENFVSYMPGSRFRYEIDTVFEQKNVTRNLLLEARTSDLICRLIARKLGVGIVGASKAHLQTMLGCVAIPFEAPLKFRAVLIWKRNQPLSAVGQVFLDVARNMVRSG